MEMGREREKDREEEDSSSLCGENGDRLTDGGIGLC